MWPLLPILSVKTLAHKSEEKHAKPLKKTTNMRWKHLRKGEAVVNENNLLLVYLEKSRLHPNNQHRVGLGTTDTTDAAGQL